MMIMTSRTATAAGAGAPAAVHLALACMCLAALMISCTCAPPLELPTKPRAATRRRITVRRGSIKQTTTQASAAAPEKIKSTPLIIARPARGSRRTPRSIPDDIPAGERHALALHDCQVCLSVCLPGMRHFSCSTAGLRVALIWSPVHCLLSSRIDSSLSTVSPGAPLPEYIVIYKDDVEDVEAATAT